MLTGTEMAAKVRIEVKPTRECLCNEEAED